MINISKFKVGDKVFVSNWNKEYSDVYRWTNGIKTIIWKWKTKIPDYSSTMFHWKYIYESNLTLKGSLNKRKPRKLVSKTPEFKNFEYTIEEITSNKEGKLIYLLSSEEGCWIQIGEGGLSTLTIKEQEKVKHLQQEKRLQILAVQNLNKWTLETANKKDFPEELLKYLYDTNQNTQFGAGMTKAIIRYPYVSKEYTVNGNDICLGWEQHFNGKGCDLTNLETVSWNQMKERFTEQNFTE